MPTNSVPEGVPTLTYITRNPPEEDPKFLRDATSFHQAWRLDPMQIDSFEEIIRDLARRKLNKKRIRIVAHAAHIGIKVPFFDNGPEELWDHHFLNAWARSDVMGFHHTIGQFPITLSNGSALLPALLGELRHTNPAVLAPFGLDTADPVGVQVDFFDRVSQLAALQNMEQGANAQLRRIINLYITVIEFLLDGRRKPDSFRFRVAEMAGVEIELVTKLEQAIIKAAPADLRLDEGALQQRFAGLRAAFRAVTRRRFRKKLNQARGHFDGTSVIDIRGCLAGNDEPFLEGISRLFAGELPGPTVTAPTLFQTFAPANSRRLFNTADVAAAVTEAGVDREARHWSSVIGAPQFLNMLPEDRLLSFLDAFVLPVGRNPTDITEVKVACDLYFFAPELSGTGSFLAPNGSSGFVAITDWLRDQWQDFPSNNLKREMERAGKKMRRAWVDQDKAPPFSGATDTQGTVFVVPDPVFRARLGFGKAT